MIYILTFMSPNDKNNTIFDKGKLKLRNEKNKRV